MEDEIDLHKGRTKGSMRLKMLRIFNLMILDVRMTR